MAEDYNIKDFDEYLRQGEPEAGRRAYAWKTAIGLQAVDGLKTSDFLIENAQRHIEGKVSLDEVQEQVRAYYQQKDNRTPEHNQTEEADKVSVNIARLLSTQTLAFTWFGFTQVHRNIFEGVFKFAGQLRDYNITKKEWVLRGDTVSYMYAADLQRALEFDLEQERQFDYAGLSIDDIIRHICKFVAGLWQIHPFPEGNTRTTAVFTIQYLRSLGFDVNNDIFAENAWYFRNALVRYIYKNRQGVQPEPKYLERFFRNLLLGEDNPLRNRYLLINPPEEWKEPTTEQVPNKYRTSTEQVPNKFDPEDKNISALVLSMGNNQWKIADLLLTMGLKHRPNFMQNYMMPAIQTGYVRMLYPNSPRHPRQRYLLTVKGQALYSYLQRS